jgi:hypothetical protein
VSVRGECDLEDMGTSSIIRLIHNTRDLVRMFFFPLFEV